MKLNKIKLIKYSSAVLLAVSLLTGCNKKAEGKYPLGLVFDDAAYEKTAKKSSQLTRDWYNLPAAASIKSYAPEIENQGEYGTCTGWASCYGGMTILESVQKNKTTYAELNEKVYSPHYMYKSLKPYDIYAEEGLRLNDVLDFLKTDGTPYRIPEEEKTPYCNFEVSMYYGYDKFKIQDYTALFSFGDTEELKISTTKKSIAEQKPVIIGFNIYESFYDATYSWKPKKNEQFLGGHAMVVVAYDDNVNGGSFLFMNSWGKDWGNNGFTWVKYSDYASYVKYGFEMQSLLLPERPSYNKVPESDIPEPRPTPPRVLMFEGSMNFPVYNKEEKLEFKYNSAIKAYESTKVYDSRTYFQIYMTNTTPCYVYAFASDEQTGKATRIFPKEGESALLNYSENTVVYPSEKECIKMDKVTGTDYLVVLYSYNELDLNFVMQAYENAVAYGFTGEGSIYKRVEKSLVGKTLLDPSDTFTKNDIEFKAISSEYDGVLPVIINIKHGD